MFPGPTWSAPAQKGLTFNIRLSGYWDAGGKERQTGKREVGRKTSASGTERRILGVCELFVNLSLDFP